MLTKVLWIIDHASSNGREHIMHSEKKSHVAMKVEKAGVNHAH